MNAGSNGETFFVVLFALGIVTAFMTAFYMFRMWFMTFTGEPGENAKHCHHESKIMVSPLVILAVFALFSGLLVFAGLGSLVENALTAMGFPSIEMETGEEIAEAIFSNVWTYVSIALALIGILLAYLMYTRKAINPGKFNRNGESALYKLLANRYFFPQLYDQISWKLGAGIAKGVDARSHDLSQVLPCLRCDKKDDFIHQPVSEHAAYNGNCIRSRFYEINTFIFLFPLCQ